MWLLYCGLLLFCPDLAVSDEEIPSFEEAVAFIELNPLPAEFFDLQFEHGMNPHVAAFLKDVDQATLALYCENADPKWRLLGVLAGIQHKSPDNLKPLLEALTDESPINVAPPYEERVNRLDDATWSWLNQILGDKSRDTIGEPPVLDQNTREKIFETLLCYGDPKHRDQLLRNHNAPRSCRHAIRTLAESGNLAALPALARFGDPRSAQLIAEHLDHSHPDSPAWLAATLLPSPRYLTYFENLEADDLLPGAAQTNHQPVFTALAAQNHERAREIATRLSLELNDATPAHTKLVWDLFAAFTQDQNTLKNYEALVIAMIRRHHIINTAAFEWVVEKDAALAEELCFSIWTQEYAIYQDTGYESLNFWYMLHEDPQEHNKTYFEQHAIEDFFPRWQHPHVAESRR